MPKPIRYVDDAIPNKYLGEYRVWVGIIARCYTRTDPFYKDFGGKGIKVTRRWRSQKTGFKNFLADMGPRPPKYWIILKRSDRNYCRSNCEWIPFADYRRKRASADKRARIRVDRARQAELHNHNE